MHWPVRPSSGRFAPLDAFSLFYQFLTAFSFLVLASIGLSIIFGVMNIINFAHAAFIMLGAVLTVSLVNFFGFPLVVAMVAATLGVAGIGMLVERLVIRRLYHRILDCLLATWAINMIAIQLIFIFMGSSQKGVGVPFGFFTVQGISYATYNMVVGLVSIAILLLIYWLFRHTDFGMRVRASMENREMAEALGTSTSTIYLITFGIGSGLAGLTGALYAPLMPVSPFFGDRFLWRAFTVVIVGGADPLLGPLMSSTALGVVYSILNGFWGTVAGSIGLLLVTMFFIRVFPQGFTGLHERLFGGRQ
jgi:branched-subunit amino acid ABC-type transport system permease component